MFVWLLFYSVLLAFWFLPIFTLMLYNLIYQWFIRALISGGQWWWYQQLRYKMVLLYRVFSYGIKWKNYLSISIICSVLSDFATPWIVTHQAPLSMEFSWREYWSGQIFLSPEDLPYPGSLTLQADSLLSQLPGIYLLANILPLNSSCLSH